MSGFTIPPAAKFISKNSVTVGAGSLQSVVFGTSTRWVRLVCSSACYILFGANPTAAAATSQLLNPSTGEFFPVYPGERVATIQVAAAGVLSVEEYTGP